MKVNNYSTLTPNLTRNNGIVNNNTQFEHYLTGLIEGDGCIITPTKLRSDKNILNYPSIQIVFNLKELPLALLIQKGLGFGSLSRMKGINAYKYTGNNKTGILTLVNILNGKMRTSKVEALYNLIDWLNNLNPDLNLIKNPISNELISSNSWLSGFIEADGHFAIRTSLNCKYPKYEVRFVLTQSQKDNRNNDKFNILNKIALFLNTKVSDVTRNRPDKQTKEYRVRTNSLKSNLILVNYLNNYPLFGSKYLDYKDWEYVVNMFKHKEHLTILGKEQILYKKSQMNDKRTEFNWNHLLDFYKGT